MSTNRLQKRLEQLTRIENDARDIPELSVIKKDKKEFLNRIKKLKKDLSKNKSKETLLTDLDAIEDQYIKLAKKELAIGKIVLEKKIHDYMEKMAAITVHLQDQLSELEEKVKVFKRIDNKNTSPKINPSPFFGNESPSDSEEPTEENEVILNKKKTILTI